jgi:GntP family gluconate:H+ symporter
LAYGLPGAQALIFLASVIVLIVATQWRPIHAFLVIVTVASAFGLLTGFSVAQLANAFGNGFAERIYLPGLVIVASSLVAGLAENTAASDRLMAAIGRWPKPWTWVGANWFAGFLGLIAGIGASPAAAFALLTPLLRPIGGKAAQSREPAAITLALAISAGHGLLLLTPVSIAAVAILEAPWARVALFGLPLALLLTVFGARFAGWLPRDEVSEPAGDEPHQATVRQSGGSAIVLVLAVAIPLLMLMLQSLGDIPSEPLGGGPARELVLGVGRPLILFLVGVGIMIAGQPRQSFALLTDSTWTANILGNVSGILLIVCAAGGLQRLCQETGMAELIGERLSGWHAGPLGVLIPLVVAATIKTLQGSSLVAAITTAGMVQPLLMPLGLGGANGKALAALAVGAGAMTVCHIHDEYFWLVADRAGLTPLRGLTALSLGTLLQGFIAGAVLLALSMFV